MSFNVSEVVQRAAPLKLIGRKVTAYLGNLKIQHSFQPNQTRSESIEAVVDWWS